MLKHTARGFDLIRGSASIPKQSGHLISKEKKRKESDHVLVHEEADHRSEPRTALPKQAAALSSHIIN
jgi:hypothetical protein